MGRKRSVHLEAIGNPDSLSRHRFADSKYRHNVQYLYSLLRNSNNKHYTKDVLLNQVSSDIKKMCEDIIQIAGSQKLMKCNDEFLKIAELGEMIWKDEKNPAFWWNQMQEVLQRVMKEDRVYLSDMDIPILSLGKISKEHNRTCSVSSSR